MPITEQDALPSAVANADAEADALMDQAIAEQSGTPVTPPGDGSTPVAPAQAVPPVRYPSLMELAGMKPEQPAPAPVAPVAPQPPRPTADERYLALQAENERLRQQNATLQGKYQAEVPRVISDNKELRNQIKELRDLVVALQKPQVPDWKKSLTPEEQEEFESAGEAMGVAGKTALAIAEANRERDRLAHEKEIEELRNQVQQQTASTQVQEFWTRVNGLVPGASDINNTTEFSAFLDTVDPATGMTYRERGEAASAKGNFGALAKVFEEFKRASGKTGTPAQESVEGQVKPDNVQGASAPVSKNQKPMIKQSEVNAFYKEVTAGAYGADPEKNEQAVKLMAIIEEAELEGRILLDQ